MTLHVVKKIGFVLLVLSFISCQRQTNIERFNSENISTHKVEYSATFSADGNEVYFARSDQEWGMGGLKSAIFYATKEQGKWSSPAQVSFSGSHDDSDPHLTHDGNTLYFISDRPSGKSKPTADIWMVRKGESDKWGIPTHLLDPINSPGREYSPRTDHNGNLYFSSDRAGGFGQGDLYMSHNKNGKLSAPLNMGTTLNSVKGEWNLEINGPGDLIIFEASQRKENVSSYGDLYISFKEDEQWTIPQNIVELNTSGSDLYPFLTSDQQFLFFTSSDSLKSRNTDIYFMQFKDIYKKYKQKATLPIEYLFVVNRSSHDISVFNNSKREFIKRIPVGIGPHEIFISDNNKYAFVANYGSYPKPHVGPISSKQLKWIDEPQNTITKIDLTDWSIQTFKIEGSHYYHGIVSNYDGSIFWITAENEGLVKEIDSKSGEVLETYKTMPGSHILRSTPDFSKLFVSNVESSTISIIDIETKEVTHIDTPKNPEGLEMSPDCKYLWILCNRANQIMVFNIDAGITVKIFESRGKFPIKLTFVNDEAWVANVFSRKISIFDATTFEFKDHIKLESTPLGIISNDSEVFITLPRKNIVKVIDSKNRKPIHEYSNGMEQDGLLLIRDVSGTIRI